MKDPVSRSDQPGPARHLHFLLSRRVEIMASLPLVGAEGLIPWTVFRIPRKMWCC